MTSIVVMEKYQDVLTLVRPYVDSVLPEGFRITYVLADVLEYQPKRDEIYDTIYFDIWPEISEDNLEEINLLHSRWKGRKNKANPRAWMGSWMQKFLQAERRRNNRYY